MHPQAPTAFDPVSEAGDRALQALALSPEAAILDVGTGKGRFAIFLASRGYRVLTGEPASDQSQYAGQDWRKAAEQAGVLENIRFQAFDAGSLPFNPASFDAVFFFGVLHHIEEDARRDVFREALRVTKPGGAVVFFEPTRGMIENLRVEDPEHPEAANPSAYLPETGAESQTVTVETIPGTWMDIFLYRKSGRSQAT